jgi:site-specific recombinase XerD
MYAIDITRMIDIEIYKFLRQSNLAKATETNYRHYLTMFYWYCVDNGFQPEQADVITVLDWLDTKPKWSNSTRVYASNAIRAFYKFKYGSEHPVTHIRIKREETPPQRTMTEEEVLQVMASLDLNSHAGIRNLAIIALMVDTGLRATEICNIELVRTDFKKNKIQVKIKGGRWGEAVYFDYTRECLARWMAVRPYVAVPMCEYLFVSTGGKNPGTQMTRFGLRTTLARICEKAGVQDVSPHVMRRTFATLATEYGAPSRLVQVAGRWKDIRMVETYTKTLQAEKLQPYSVVNRLMGFRKDEQS